MNKKDCQDLLVDKGQHRYFCITKLGGIIRFVGPDHNSRPVSSWELLYAEISSLPNLRIPKDAVDPKGMTDEQLAELGKSA